LIALDPDSSWKDMKKAGRKLFQALGELRDMQVMREWIERLNDRKSFSYSPGDGLSPVACPGTATQEGLSLVVERSELGGLVSGRRSRLRSQSQHGDANR
jgi:hypothetical protein